MRFVQSLQLNLRHVSDLFQTDAVTELHLLYKTEGIIHK